MPPSQRATQRRGCIYSKFECSGFYGSFADLNSFHGGLHKLLGAWPAADALQAMQLEHCGKQSGFGASEVV